LLLPLRQGFEAPEATGFKVSTELRLEVVVPVEMPLETIID